MKILHVLPGLTRGGAERVVVDLANEHSRHDNDVTIVTLFAADRELAPAPLDPEIGLRSIVQNGDSHRFAYPWLLSWTVRNRSFLLDQDVVHVHLTGPAILGSIIQLLKRIARRQRPVVIETYHAVGMAIPEWKRALHKTLLMGRDGVALMAEDDYWRRFQVLRPGHTVRLIPNGVSLVPATNDSEAKGVRRLAGVSPDVRLVGSIGRLKHERRPDALILAFAEAARRLPSSVHFLLGGEGPERPGLAELADRLGVRDRVHFCGLVRDAAAVFVNLDLYVTVNVGPITGIAALEAAMSGLPVIAFQMLPTFAPGAGDWIWSSNDPVAVGQRLSELMMDADARLELAKRQQAYALEHHSLDAMARAYDGLYDAALRRHGKLSDAHQ